MEKLEPRKTSADIQEEVEDQWVPGTVHFVDLDQTLNVKHNGDSDLVLIPQPSDDPNDPLRWSQKKKKFKFCT